MRKYIFLFSIIAMMMSCSHFGFGESDWEVVYYEDEFGEPTNDSYVRKILDGSFSNPVKSNGYLKVVLSLDDNMANIRLLTYGENETTIIGSPFEISLRNLQKEDLKVISYQNEKTNKGILVLNDEYEKLKKYLLSSTGKIKAVVSDKPGYYYSFEFSPEGLEEMLNNL